MEIRLYAVYNTAVGSFVKAPFVGMSDEDAKLAFIACCNDLATVMGNSPSEFALFHVGYFDIDTGVLHSSEMKNLGLGVRFKREQENGETASVGDDTRLQQGSEGGDTALDV